MVLNHRAFVGAMNVRDLKIRDSCFQDSEKHFIDSKISFYDINEEGNRVAIITYTTERGSGTVSSEKLTSCRPPSKTGTIEETVEV